MPVSGKLRRSLEASRAAWKRPRRKPESISAIKPLLLLIGFFFFSLTIGVTSAPGATASSENSNQSAARSVPAKQAEKHGLPQKAVEIARPFGFPITNSMVVSWMVAAALIIFARLATRDMKTVPGGAQNLLEWLVGGLYDFLEKIIGRRLIKRTFWFLATVFIFILSANWVGLVPGVGTLGWGHQSAHGFVVEQPLFRGANADLNLTLAMALVFFACWFVWALQEVGPGGFVKELFAPKGETTGALRLLMFVVFFAASC